MKDALMPPPVNWRVYDDLACAELEYRGIDLELCAERGVTFFFSSFLFFFFFSRCA